MYSRAGVSSWTRTASIAADKAITEKVWCPNQWARQHALSSHNVHSGLGQPSVQSYRLGPLGQTLYQLVIRLNGQRSLGSNLPEEPLGRRPDIDVCNALTLM